MKLLYTALNRAGDAVKQIGYFLWLDAVSGGPIDLEALRDVVDGLKLASDKVADFIEEQS